MRQRQRGSCGVENAATCMGCSRLPAAPTESAAPRSAAASSAAAQARGLGDLDLQRAPVEFLAVELLDGRIGLLGRRHLHEAESARAPGVTVHDDRGRLDGADLGEDLAQPLVRRREGQTADEELLCHGAPLNRSPAVDGTPWYAEDGAKSWSGRRRSAMNRHRGQTRTVWHVSSPSGLLFCQLPEVPRPARGGLRRAVRRHPGHVLPRWSRPPYARARDEINEELRLAGTCSRVSLNRVASSWSPPPGCSRATSRWRRPRRP